MSDKKKPKVGDPGSGRKKEPSYFASGRKRRTKSLIIIVPIIAVVVGVLVASVVIFTSEATKYGALNSAHEHAALLVKINGQNLDFSQDKYQVQSRYIHVEGGDGATLHRHSTSVPVGEFFSSVDMKLDQECIQTDDGTRHCEDEEGNKLQFFVNKTKVDSIHDYILQEDDRILVIYGNQTQDQINSALDELDKLEIKKL